MEPSFLLIHIEDSTFHRRPSVPLSLQRGKRAACFPFAEFLNSYLYTKEHSALLLQSHWVARSRAVGLLSKDKVLSLLATSLLNRNPYGFPINGSPVF